MMKRNFKSKFLIIFILISLITCTFVPLVSFAMSSNYLNPSQFDDSSYNTFSTMPLGAEGITIGGVLRQALGVILTVIRTIAVGWAIIMAVLIAIKYMTGNSDAKAQLKTDMPTYIIGAVLLFGGAGLITIIQYFMEDVFVV